MALKFITIHDSEPKVNNFVVPPIQVLLYKAFNKRNDGVGSKPCIQCLSRTPSWNKRVMINILLTHLQKHETLILILDNVSMSESYFQERAPGA